MLEHNTPTASESDIVIVGYDCVTPLGDSVQETFQNARAGKSGVRRLRGSENDFIDIGGEIEFDWRREPALRSWTEPACLIIPDLIDQLMSRLSLHDAIRTGQLRLDEIGTISGCAFPGISPQHNLKTVGSTVKGLLCVTASVPLARMLMRHNFGGEVHFVSTACATGGHALLMARSLLLTQQTTRLIFVCCWDFPMIDVVLKGFQLSKSLFRYQPDDRAHGDPAKASRPLSADRAGLVPSEGVALMAVTTRKLSRELNLPVAGRLLAAASSGGAKSHVMADEDSVVTCLRRSLNGHLAESLPTVDLISAHANSTQVGDAAEVNALYRVFGDRLSSIPIVSIQEHLGHTFGASMLIQSIMAFEMMNHQVVLPMSNYVADSELPPLRIAREAAASPIYTALILGTGFGGVNVSLLVDSGV